MQDGNAGGIVLDSCRGVTLQGASTLTYPKPQYPYAQGTVLAASADSMNFHVQVVLRFDTAVFLCHVALTS